MCGILGLVTRFGNIPGATISQVEKMRDRMFNRGPDADGIVAHKNVLFAHRLLAVIDPGHGPQPMWSDDKRFLLVYNGELYNDDELREQLRRNNPSIEFKSRCDTETVLRAFERWGTSALEKMRGMFALGVYDFQTCTLTLARDPLGIKPLYFAVHSNNDECIFASHVPAMLEYPAITPKPNPPAISAYLSTLKTTTGNETLFKGVQTLRPGQWATIKCNGNRDHNPLKIQITDYGSEIVDSESGTRSFDESTIELREAVIDSIGRHLRSDVPICLLLSGGLDSAIIGSAAKHLGASQALRTWCAGDCDDTGGDRRFAREMADHLGADHHDVIIDRPTFHRNWGHLIQETGLPLGTPNETAIFEVASSLKQHATVALSGEGADELFAGYSLPLLSGIDQINASQPASDWPGNQSAHDRYQSELKNQYGTADLGSPARHFLRCNSWIHPDQKPDLFNPFFLESMAGDSLLFNEVDFQFSAQTTNETTSPEQLLQIQRRLNLTGLLRRLDSATMAAQVEGRTPFSDSRIAQLAAAIPFNFKMKTIPAPDGGYSSAMTLVNENRVTTKMILRKAFEDWVPRSILDRPKASFPLPFQAWIGNCGGNLRNSPFLKEITKPDILAVVAENPEMHWQIAWPLLNIAKWSDRWWG